MRKKLMWWTGAAVAVLLAAVVVLDWPEAEAAIEPYCTPGPTCFQCCCEYANARCRWTCIHFPEWCEDCHMPICNACFEQKCMEQE